MAFACVAFYSPYSVRALVQTSFVHLQTSLNWDDACPTGYYIAYVPTVGNIHWNFQHGNVSLSPSLQASFYLTQRIPHVLAPSIS